MAASLLICHSYLTGTHVPPHFNLLFMQSKWSVKFQMTEDKPDVGIKQMFQLLSSTRLSVSLEGGNPAEEPSSCCFCPSYSEQPFTLAEAFCGTLKSSSILVPLTIYHVLRGQKFAVKVGDEFLPSHEMENMTRGESLLTLKLSRFSWAVIFN